jgi:exonuclease III
MTFKIKIATWNANGIINKIDETKTFLMTEKIDIMIINETKLTSNDKLYFNNYKTYRQDRPTNTRAGGVAIIIKSDIAHRQIKNDNTNSIETVTIELANRVAVTAAYNRPETLTQNTVTGIGAGLMQTAISLKNTLTTTI